MSQNLVLASTSESRKKLLERLKIPFTVAPSNVDETVLPNEKPEDLVLRLAKLKAEAVATKFSDALIIGADQVGVLENTILCKPLNSKNAIEQLQFVSGKTVRFYIGVCLLNTKTKAQKITLETFDVVFRALSLSEIENYLKKEEVMNCAGSFKVEGLGISLVEKLIGDDYTALIGLPLIKLVTLLKAEKYVI